MDNARLLLQIDNTKLAQDDYNNKYISPRYVAFRCEAWPPVRILSHSLLFCRLDDEIKARKLLEKDVNNLKKTHEDTKLNCKQTQQEIDLVKEELEHLNQDHKHVSATQASRVD